MSMRTKDHEVAESLFFATGAHKLCAMSTLQTLQAAFPIGSRWKHFRSDNLYVLLGFNFDTEADEWAIRYKRIRPSVSIEFSRVMSSFFSHANNGDMMVNRFVQTDEVP